MLLGGGFSLWLYETDLEIKPGETWVVIRYSRQPKGCEQLVGKILKYQRLRPWWETEVQSHNLKRHPFILEAPLVVDRL